MRESSSNPLLLKPDLQNLKDELAEPLISDLKRERLNSGSLKKNNNFVKRMKHSIEVLVKERKYLVHLVNSLLSLNSHARNKLENMNE